MADQGIWFKLWCASDDDPDLSILPIADFGRWCKFGTYTKRFGTEGVIILTEPHDGIHHPLESKFQLPCFKDVIACISCFPTCIISPVSLETTANVSYRIEWRNWRKYQGDFSSDRVRKHRAKMAQNETPKKRGEEKRGEEKRVNTKNAVPSESQTGTAPPSNGFSDWPPEWHPILQRIETLPFLAHYKHWLNSLDWWKSMDELFSSCPKNLDSLLLEAAAYCETEGYRPMSRAGIRKKLRNCMEFSARKAERNAKEGRGHSV